MTDKNIIPLTERFTNGLHTAQLWIDEGLSFASPILTPLLSAYLIFSAIQQPPFNWPTWAAVLLGVVMEILGISVISTAITILYQGRDWTRKAIAIIGPSIYTVASFLIVVTVKSGLLSGYNGAILGITYSCFVAFALVSALNLAVRRDHYQSTPPPKRQPKRHNRPKSTANGQFVPGDMNALQSANSSRRTIKEARQAVVLERLNAGQSMADIANDLSVGYSTIRRDVKELNGQVAK